MYFVFFAMLDTPCFTAFSRLKTLRKKLNWNDKFTHINEQNNSGSTLLHLSVEHGLIFIKDIELLLQLGADPNIQDLLGQTPLQVNLFCSNEGDIEILLTAFGADHDIPNLFEETMSDIKSRFASEKKLFKDQESLKITPFCISSEHEQKIKINTKTFLDLLQTSLKTNLYPLQTPQQIENLKKEYSDENVHIFDAFPNGLLTYMIAGNALYGPLMTALKNCISLYNATPHSTLLTNILLLKNQIEMTLSKDEIYYSLLDIIYPYNNTGQYSVIFPLDINKHLKNVFVSHHISFHDQQLKEILLKEIKPFLAKKQFTWELLRHFSTHQSLNRYLEKFRKKEYKVGNDVCEFYDLTQADDYRFIVNTVISKPDRLKELEQGEGTPLFFDTTTFFSATLMDKNTRAFAGGHQQNHLFPLYLALEVPYETIFYTAPIDIDSPFGIESELQEKLDFIKSNFSNRIEMDLREAYYQEELSHSFREPILPPSSISHLIESDPAYKKPEKDSCYSNPGKIPLYSVDKLIKETNLNPRVKNAYNEITISGNKLNLQPNKKSSQKENKVQGHLLIVEKHFLDKFNQDYPKLKNDKKQHAIDSLAILKNIEVNSKGRIKLVLVETNLDGYIDKLPLAEQYRRLNDGYNKLYLGSNHELSNSYLPLKATKERLDFLSMEYEDACLYLEFKKSNLK